MNESLNELALFAGAGGGILGGKLLGWRTVCAVEIDPYAAGVLSARQNDGSLPPFPIWDDIATFDGRPWRGLVDVVSGGFPCQDISAAGRGAGITGARSGLWREMSRIIGEVGPRHVLVENSPVLTSRGLGVVLGDLAAMGYDARWGVLGAYHTGAPHKRERIWILANARGGRCSESQGREVQQPGRAEAVGASGDVPHSNGRRPPAEQECVSGSADQADSCRDGAGEDVAHAASERREGRILSKRPGRPLETKADPERNGEAIPDANRDQRFGGGGDVQMGRSGCAGEAQNDGHSGGAQWSPEPDVGRVAHGVASRVDRLRCIGNGQVPDVVRLAWYLLRPIEED
jgi:DNA (cytosine-5)-methyltransferase 1